MIQFVAYKTLKVHPLLRLLLTDLKMAVLTKSPEIIQQTKRTLHEINAFLQVAEAQSNVVMKESDGKASK